MNNKQIARLAGFLTLSVMAFTGISFLLDDARAPWPHFYIFALFAWLHGICWGYLYAVQGRFTWL